MVGTTYDQVLYSAYGCVNNFVDQDNIFTSIFKRGDLKNGCINEYGADNKYNPSALMTAALRYFKKSSVQTASMFNNITFPSILFGAGMLKHIGTTLAKTFEGVGADANEQMKVFIYMIRNFITNGGNYKLYWDVRSAHAQTDNVNDKHTNADFRSLLNGDANAIVVADNHRKLLDRTTAPSLCAQMMYTFADMCLTNAEEAKKRLIKFYAKDEQKLDEIKRSPVGAFIRESDVLSTYAFAVHEVLLKTSYWSHEVNRYNTYAETVSREPFSFNIMDQ
jgi:hypothetical protein